MNSLDLFPEAATWDIDKLISDINAIRNKYKKRELTETNQSYLYGALVGYNPKDISHELGLNGDGKAIRAALSTEINPYIRELLGYPKDLEKMNWQRACVLLEKAGYKKPFLPEDSQDSSVMKIKLDSDNASMADVETILAKIRIMTQDDSIEIKDIRKGCIEFVFSGSEEGLKRLESLIKSGELTEINGVKIISAESGIEPSKVVHLSNWFDNLVESSWEALEQFLSPRQLQFETIRSGDISKGKLIDRTMLDDGFAVVLTLNQKPLTNGSVDIVLRIYPTNEQAHLPEDIKLRILCRDENGKEISRDTEAKNEDEWIQLHFTGEPSEEFAVEIVKGDVSVVENFVI